MRLMAVSVVLVVLTVLTVPSPSLAQHLHVDATNDTTWHRDANKDGDDDDATSATQR